MTTTTQAVWWQRGNLPHEGILKDGAGCGDYCCSPTGVPVPATLASLRIDASDIAHMAKIARRQVNRLAAECMECRQGPAIGRLAYIVAGYDDDVRAWQDDADGHRGRGLADEERYSLIQAMHECAAALDATDEAFGLSHAECSAECGMQAAWQAR